MTEAVVTQSVQEPNAACSTEEPKLATPEKVSEQKGTINSETTENNTDEKKVENVPQEKHDDKKVEEKVSELKNDAPRREKKLKEKKKVPTPMDLALRSKEIISQPIVEQITKNLRTVGFNQTLNGVSLDDATAAALKKFLLEEKKMTTEAVHEKVIHREFKRCLNMLRSVGKRGLAKLLDVPIEEVAASGPQGKQPKRSADAAELDKGPDAKVAKTD